MSINKIAAIILAAGSGKRFGSPKALATYENQTFLNIIIKKLDALSIDYVAVLSPTVKELLDFNIGSAYTINSSQNDMFSSVVKGLECMSEYDGWIIWAVDHPFIKSSTIELISKHFNFEKVLIPTYNSIKGHPIILTKDALKYTDVSSTLKELINNLKHETIETNDKNILRNINWKKDLLNE